MFKDGVININKPSDWTSQDVCAKLRGRLHIRKIGHTGTLDPMATGVLPVCIGKATRIIEYYDKDFKSYHAQMKLGTVTDTLDISGEILSEKPCRIVKEKAAADNEINESDLLKAFSDYTGDISQIPPKYSAIRIDGKRAYDLAREGKDVNIKPRLIRILSNNVCSLDYEKGVVEFDVVCSKGTYIRTICDDIGRSLGCGACMTSLVRTSSGCFKLENSVELGRLIEMSDEEIEELIIPMDITLEKLGTVMLNEGREKAFCNGHPTSVRTINITKETDFDNLYRVYTSDGRFLGVAAIENDELVPCKVVEN